MTSQEPKSRTSQVQQRWSQSLMNTYGTPPIALAAGRGSRVIDVEGREYIDLLAGIAVSSLGHAHPQVVAAVSHQIATLAHSSNLWASEPVIAVAEELCATLNHRSGSSDARAFFCNSGAEANEAALKIARLTQRRRILAAHHGFHGRTLGALALTGQPEKRAPFEPLAGQVEFFPYGDIDYLRSLVAQDPHRTAAIIVEPVQGETGVIPAPPGFLQAIRDICDEFDILFIADEVQTGVGRTGTFFGWEAEPTAVPDIITLAKGLGAGLPIGAVLARGRAAQLFQPGHHGTTFGGNPVACAAARVVLKTVDEPFLEQVRAHGALLAELLAQLPGVEHVRGRGLMLGVVLRHPVAKQMVSLALAPESGPGLLLNAPAADVVRLVPPLVITEADIRQAVDIFAGVLEQAIAAAASSVSLDLKDKEEL